MATERRLCIIHLEELGLERPARHRDDEMGDLCGDCWHEIAASRGHERHNDAKFAAACGYRD